MHVKKGDNVIVLAGKDRGVVGEVLEVDDKKSRVKVNRANIMIKHRKPQAILGLEGARIEVENWIHSSNVAIYSDSAKKGVRAQKRFVGKENALFGSKAEAVESFGDAAPKYIQKVRYCVETEEVFDEIRG